MSQAQKIQYPSGYSSLTAEQRQKLDEARKKWDEKFRDLAEGIEEAGRITEDDLAIRIVSRD